MDGLKLACIYSWNCEMARSISASKTLFHFADKKVGEVEKIKKILGHLDTDQYYREITKRNDWVDTFDVNIVSSYWTGSPKLNGNIWHNYTTLIPLLRVPISGIASELIDECVVHCGEVKSVSSNKVTVSYNPIIKENGKLVFGELREKVIEHVFNHFSVKKGDSVAFHFSICTEILKEKECGRLINITKDSLSRFNREHSKQ